jgi:transcription antitermination protein NusB
MERPDERSDARERALYLLYEAHSKGIAPAATIDIQVLEPDELTQELVRGVDAHLDQLDELIASKAKGWTLSRMPVLDLSVMRLAVFELLERPHVPTAVVLNEAVELAKRYSTDDSGRFVNGVLAAIAGDVRPTA